MLEEMSAWASPGAALAVTVDGRLVFAHGYGYADVAAQQPVQPDSLFRVASDSKPFTATAILKLIEPTAGRIRLHGHDITDLSPAEMRPHRRELQVIFQDPYSSLNPRLSAGAIVGEPLTNYGIAKGRVVAMAPGTNWPTKQWRSDGFAEVARHLLQKNCAVTLVGSDRERAVCEAVAGLAPGAVNLAGETTVSELAALIRRASVCVTNDSGPMHLAAALDRPVVSIFGPTDPVWAGPYRRDGAVVRVELPCSPCYLRRLARCMHGHACMENVSAGAVIERAESILAKLPSRAKAPAPQAGRR